MGVGEGDEQRCRIRKQRADRGKLSSRTDQRQQAEACFVAGGQTGKV